MRRPRSLNQVSSTMSDQVDLVADPKYTNLLLKKIVEGTRDANGLPTPDDFKYFNSFPAFTKDTQELSNQLIDVMSNIASTIQPNEKLIKDQTDDSDRYEILTDAVDLSLERVDYQLDELRGLHNQTILSTDKGDTNMISAQGRSFGGKNSSSSRRKLRPQDNFSSGVDNSHTRFVPILRTKPNAMQPLEILDPEKQNALSSVMDSHLSSLGVEQHSDRSASHPHPYQYEIERFDYLPNQLAACKEQLYRSLSEVPCHWVDTEDQLSELSQKLDSQTEFAIDLEHHSQHSYHGFTCLMQLSTRSEDFLVDVLELREHMGVLNSSFTNPKIVKVLHGADHDVLWLQRDFGIYIVNMFDTGQAARALEFPGFGLAYLLKHYCGVTTEKRYQLADWRIRPLSAEMLLYARQDTHYLLYIYDRLRNACIEQTKKGSFKSSSKTDIDYLTCVLDKSRQLCLKRYEKFMLTSESHFSIIKKFGLTLNEQQRRCLKALYSWRDNLARERDESPGVIVSTHIMVTISRNMPQTVQQLSLCVRAFPFHLRSRSQEVVQLLQEARHHTETPSHARHLPDRDQTLPSPMKRDDETVDPMIITPMKSTSGRESPHANLISPVLSTEELYNSAGWTRPDTNGHTTTYITPPDVSDVTTTSFLSPDVKSMVFCGSSDEESEDAEDLANRETAKQVHASFEGSSLIQAFAMTPKNKSVIKMDLDTPRTPRPAPGEDSPSMERTPQMGVKESPSSTRALSTALSPPDDSSVPNSLQDIYKMSNKNRKKNKQKKKLKAAYVTDQTPTPNSQSTSSSSSSSLESKGLFADASADSDSDEIDPLEEYTSKKSGHMNTDEFMKHIGWPVGTDLPVLSQTTSKDGDPSNVSTASPTRSRTRRKKGGLPGSPHTRNTNRRRQNSHQQTNPYYQHHNQQRYSQKSFVPFDYNSAQQTFAPPQGSGGRGRGGRGRNTTSSAGDIQQRPAAPQGYFQPYSQQDVNSRQGQRRSKQKTQTNTRNANFSRNQRGRGNRH